jgi:ATP-dependent Clp protease ATP-binding subunit ClpA
VNLDKLRNLEAHLKSVIRGQDHVIGPICSVFQRGEQGLIPPGRPRGRFLFLGPTGVGKTEMAKTLAHYLFDQDLTATQAVLDMGNYQTQDTLPQLIGDKTGSPGRLGELLHSKTARVILFDEMEKAHPQIHDIFLPILDAGRLTTGDGVTHDLSSYYLIFTSNIASREIAAVENLPFSMVERYVLSSLTEYLRPEFVGRFQAQSKLVFNKLSLEACHQITQDLIHRQMQELALLGHSIQMDALVPEFLFRRGFDLHSGARPLRDAIEYFIGNALSSRLLQEKPTQGKLAVHPSNQHLEIVLA